ncbi:MAG: response regulator receiver protein [Phycisphaerales bacterium]|nr:response regulator receiver protein [Phycisphaerales bacterium]
MPAHSTSTTTILVVDDSSVCRDLFSKLLLAEGFTVVTAVDGLDALARLAKQPIDAILLDYEMPNLNGLGFLKIVRNEPKLKSMPVIMLTTTVTKEVIIEATKFGISGYLLKPRLSIPDLITRIRQAIAKNASTAAPAASPPSGRPLGAAPAPAASPAALPVAPAAPPAAASVQVASPPAATAPQVVAAPTVTPASSVAPAPTVAPSPPVAAVEPPPPAAPRPRRRMPEPTSIYLPNLVPKEATLKAIADISTAKTLGGVLAQMSEVADSPKAHISEVANVVKQDPVLCARVVQLAGSAAYGGSKTRIGGVDDAVRILGIAVVRQLAMSMAVFSTFPSSGADGIELMRCWHHSLTVAAIMGRIVPKNEGTGLGLPYLVGLCHDLPEILLRQRFPGEYTALVDYAVQADVMPCELTKQVFGAPQSEISDALYEQLKLPAPISGPIKEFELSVRAPADLHASVLGRSLAVANFLAHAAQCASSPQQLIAPIQEADCRSILLSPNAINMVDIRAETLATACMISGADAAQQAELQKPMFAKREVKVWYVRQPDFAPLDPIEVALSNLCKLEVQSRLPVGEEAAELRGLVIVSQALLPAAAEAQRIVAKSGRTLPVLNLTRNDPANIGPAVNGIEECAYPIPLSKLASFIAGLAA